MNRTYIYTALALVVVIGGILIFTASAHKGEPVVISVATSTIQQDSSSYTIKADYPVFGLQILDDKTQAIIETGIDDLEGQAANPSPNGTKNEFQSTFDHVYIDPDLVSVRLILSEYTGGAHNISVATALNYNRSTGGFLTLDDALSLTGDTLTQISAAAKVQLAKQYGSVAFPEGITPTTENFATFTVDKDNVTFVLQEYQAEPYSDGMPEVVVPRTK